MYRILFLLLTLFFAVENSMAQSAEDIVAPKHSDFAGMDEAENPDEAGAAMPSIGISEEKVIVEVVEGVGHIPYNKTAFRDKPSLKGKVLRYSSGAEKVILIGETQDWYKVIMYNNQEAYIQKKYVRTTKLFMDETVARNQMNKTLSIELDDLLAKFEDTLSNSNYTKNKVSTVGKLLDSQYNIVEVVPMVLYSDIKYDDKGNVVDYSKEYAVISLNPANVNMEEVRSKNISILSLAQSTIPINDLFKTYPR